MTVASGAPIRLLVVAAPGTEPTVREVFEELDSLGVELVFGAGRRGHRVPASLLERPGVSVAEIPLEREGKQGRSVRTLRHGANTLRFMDPALGPAASFSRRVTTRALFTKIRSHEPEVALGIELPPKMFERLTGVARDLERLLPPHPELEDAVRELRPDGVLLLSRCGLLSVELDLIKVARRLDVPSVLLVHSWDNLTSKAVLHEEPDRLLVWNDTMAWEASAYHGIDPDRIESLGAPIFDAFFALARATPDEPPAETRLLYLGSSPYVTDGEASLFGDWLAAVRSSSDEELRDAPVDVRPHPADHSWDDWETDDALVSVHSSRRLEEHKLLGLIRGASAVVGLNTSAELEAAIGGRPVVTWRPGIGRAPGQEGTLHFPYLLEESGGFVVDSRDLDEHVANLGQAVRAGADVERTQRFLESFLRPRGLGRPVAPIVAATVASVVERRPLAASRR